MIKKLKLEYFMRHESLEVEFGAGLQCIRGWNESGKSSVINAIAYALFGTKALRTSLEDAVTWGKDAKSLKVELDVVLDNKTYTFKRAKGGAEVVVDGAVFVTGQSEVSKFAESMLGADMNVARKLMFAGQGAIRGALEEGPKALSELIENLAGFDVFDNILEAAQHKLALGSPALIEERLKGARATLEAATATLPPKPEPIDGKVEALNAEIDAINERIPELTEARKKAADAHAVVAEQYLKGIALRDAVKKEQDAWALVKTQHDKLQASASRSINETHLEHLRQQVKDAENYEAKVGAWRKFQALPVERFDGTAADFQKAQSDNAGEKKRITTDITEVNNKVRDLKGKRIDSDVCDKCGQGITHLPHVVETNASIDAQMGPLHDRIAELEQAFLSACAEENRLAGIQRAATGIPIKQLMGFVEIDESTYPATMTWLGGAVPDAAPVAPRQELARMETEVADIAKAKAQFELLNAQLVAAHEKVEVAQQTFDAFDFPDGDYVLELSTIEGRANQAVLDATSKITFLENDIAEIKRDHEMATKLWAAHAERVKDAEKVIAQCEADLDSLSFNNALVAKLRKIRPLVANKVWNTVLSGVSAMFSQIRGLPSVITKEKDGFKCDGQAVESLSGSTLDALGLALRVALIRTFVPHCGLLVLDEVTAAMDSGRTVATLGFIKTIDMGQTLLITHEDVSELFSDNIIELGEKE